AIHVQLPVRPEHDFQENLPLEIQLARLLRIDRLGLVDNLYRLCRRPLVHILVGGRTNLLCGKARSLDPLAISAAITLPGLRYPIAEPGTCNCPFNSFCSTSAITGSGAFRKIKGPELGSH